MPQAKCTTCKVRHQWTGPQKVTGSKCPDCGAPMERTTFAVQLPSKHWPDGLPQR